MQRIKDDEKACASGAVITIDENACASGPSTDPSSLSSTGRGGPRRLIWEGPLLADEDIGPVVGPENFAVAWPIKTVLSIYKHPRIDGFGMIDNGNPGILKIALTIVPRGSVRIIIIRRPEDITLLIRVKLPVKTATESILGRDQPDDCQNSGFKARNYVDLYCESDWDYVNEDSRRRDTTCVRAV
jgi:hypothetical protein